MLSTNPGGANTGRAGAGRRRGAGFASAAGRRGSSKAEAGELRQPRPGAPVLGVHIDAVAWPEALSRIQHWAARRDSRYVCLCNVHSVVTARGDATFRAALQRADLVTPDGMPVAWMLRRQGHPEQARINGPDLMWSYCRQAARRGERVFLYGNTPETLEALSDRLKAAFGLEVAGTYSPPFRELTVGEDEAVVEAIHRSGAAVVFVSLGCPKQEQWMAEHRGRIRAVMIGVGMAFAYHAGTARRAPGWAQKAGLEWLYRLCAEPRRLWRRYLVTNTLFVLGAGRQLLGRYIPRRAAGRASVPWVVSATYYEF